MMNRQVYLGNIARTNLQMIPLGSSYSGVNLILHLTIPCDDMMSLTACKSICWRTVQRLKHFSSSGKARQQDIRVISRKMTRSPLPCRYM